MPGEKSQPRLTPRKIYALTDIKRVRTALEPDPKNPTHGGTEALRKGLHPRHAGRAIVLDCVEIKILQRVRAKSSTPSTRRLLDGMAMPVPHRSTECATG